MGLQLRKHLQNVNRKKYYRLVTIHSGTRKLVQIKNTIFLFSRLIKFDVDNWGQQKVTHLHNEPPQIQSLPLVLMEDKNSRYTEPQRQEAQLKCLSPKIPQHQQVSWWPVSLYAMCQKSFSSFPSEALYCCLYWYQATCNTHLLVETAWNPGSCVIHCGCSSYSPLVTASIFLFCTASISW